ncbi:hypothetical protein PENSUB_6171 [Penicillium subrubescens]|uniref:Uncharacterized protein n=1 Tax=Penicillium subrubescens TaxID=1316194 RepID=A0A1Q5U3D0_9EURO|nr:hypothetical protein PENSUB_6171 [Penicillium subrubescens]
MPAPDKFLGAAQDLVLTLLPTSSTAERVQQPVLLQQAPTVVAEYVRVSLQTQTTVALAETSVPEIASTANVTVQLRIRSVLRLEIAARPATHVSTVVLAQDAATTLNSVRLHLSPAVPLFA